jgi:hypothetical protein
LHQFVLRQADGTVSLEVQPGSGLFVGEAVQRRLEAVARSIGAIAAIIERDIALAKSA